MILNIIHQNGSDSECLELLIESASELKLKVNVINPENSNFIISKKFQDGDLLYRTAKSKKSKIFEKLLITPKVATFYKNFYDSFVNHDLDNLYFEQLGLPSIPAIYSIATNKEELKTQVDFLGGFPVILKSKGFSHGQGIIKIDTIDSLFSVSQLLSNRKENYFIMKKFIEHERQARLIVIGNKVVASHENIIGSDFRTNSEDATSRKRRANKYSLDIEQIAVSAVNALNREFGGVDILFDTENKPYIAEVNQICFFPTTQKISGVNISKLMIEFLIEKSKKLNS